MVFVISYEVFTEFFIFTFVSFMLCIQYILNLHLLNTATYTSFHIL